MRLTKTKLRERNLKSLVPCLKKNLHVVMLIKAKRFWKTKKSGTECTDQLVLTEDESLALNKVKDSLKYEKGNIA